MILRRYGPEALICPILNDLIDIFDQSTCPKVSVTNDPQSPYSVSETMFVTDNILRKLTNNVGHRIGYLSLVNRKC